MAKVDTLIEKYKGQISARTINALNNGDTTKTKKYLEYMCRMWLEIRRAPQVIKPVMEFDSLLPYIENKDIYHSDYSDFNFLFEVIEEAKEIKEEKTFVREEHVDVLIENDRYIMLIPKTHRGSLKYGKGTKWCTSMNDYEGHFRDYSRDGYLIYLSRKNEKRDIWDKVAFYVENDNATFGHVTVYTSNDIEKSDRDFFSSTWDMEDILYIISYIRQYVTYCEYRKHAKDEVKSIKNMLSQIDVTKLIHYKNVLSDENEMFKDVFDTMTEINEKLSKIKV